MNIYYTGVLKNDQDQTHNLLIDYLKSEGHVVTPYLIDHQIEDTETEQELAFKILSNIVDADIFIGEMSMPSQTLGFQLSYATQHNKPCLYLYKNNTLGKPKIPLYGNPSRLITVKAYSQDDYKEVLRKYFIKAESQLLTDRITFVSTRKINDFIDKKVASTGLSKGEIIRGLLEEAIEQSENKGNKQV